jgi:hypothetical protein
MWVKYNNICRNFINSITSCLSKTIPSVNAYLRDFILERSILLRSPL